MQEVTLAVLVVLVAVRLPAAVRNPRARPAWFATLFGALGLTTIGVIVPLEGADGLLGNTNLIMLARTVFPVAAFWSLRSAIAIQSGRPLGRAGNPLILVAMLLSQVVAFFLIPDRGYTSADFVNSHLTSIGGWLWAVLYAAQMSWIAASAAMLVMAFWRSIFITFVLGAIFVVLGAVCELLHSSAMYTHIIGHTSRDMFSVGFVVFFYPGIALIAAGFLINVLLASARQWAWRYRLVQLRRIRNHYANAPTALDTELGRQTRRSDPAVAAYGLVIAIRNLEALTHVQLADADSAVVANVEHRFARVLPSMSGS